MGIGQIVAVGGVLLLLMVGIAAVFLYALHMQAKSVERMLAAFGYEQPENVARATLPENVTGEADSTKQEPNRRLSRQEFEEQAEKAFRDANERGGLQ